MEFGQLKDYNINIFLEKSYTTCGGEASRRPFLSILLDQQSEMLYSLFLFYVQVKDFQNILKLKFWPLALTLRKVF